jgi:hypothetical protein
MGTFPALRWAIAAAAVAASLAGCHVPFVSKAGSGAGSGSSSVPASLNTCTIYAQHYNAEVIVTPGRTSECDTLITNLTGSGMVWAGPPNTGSMGDLTEQCDLTSTDGTYEAVVMDESGASVGHATCNGFETAGWTANTQAGPLARFVAAHQQALLQQQATVAASAGQAQQVTSAQQALATDLTTLQSADLSTLQSLHAAATVNPASVIAAGNTALASAWNSISTAQGQGKTIITEAQALAATAQSLASQHGC